MLFKFDRSDGNKLMHKLYANASITLRYKEENIMDVFLRSSSAF